MLLSPWAKVFEVRWIQSHWLVGLQGSYRPIRMYAIFGIRLGISKALRHFQARRLPLVRRWMGMVTQANRPTFDFEVIPFNLTPKDWWGSSPFTNDFIVAWSLRGPQESQELVPQILNIRHKDNFLSSMPSCQGHIVQYAGSICSICNTQCQGPQYSCCRCIFCTLNLANLARHHSVGRCFRSFIDLYLYEFDLSSGVPLYQLPGLQKHYQRGGEGHICLPQFPRYPLRWDHQELAQHLGGLPLPTPFAAFADVSLIQGFRCGLTIWWLDDLTFFAFKFTIWRYISTHVAFTIYHLQFYLSVASRYKDATATGAPTRGFGCVRPRKTLNFGPRWRSKVLRLMPGMVGGYTQYLWPQMVGRILMRS